MDDQQIRTVSNHELCRAQASIWTNSTINAEAQRRNLNCHQLVHAELIKERDTGQSNPPDPLDIEVSRAAAEKGDPQAQFELGVKYQIVGNLVDAASWYRKSAEQGNVKAQVRLGVLYEIGNGVEKDYIQADVWYIIAVSDEKMATMTAEDAKRRRNSIEARMTPEQIAEARKRAAEWKPS